MPPRSKSLLCSAALAAATLGSGCALYPADPRSAGTYPGYSGYPSYAYEPGPTSSTYAGPEIALYGGPGWGGEGADRGRGRGE